MTAEAPIAPSPLGPDDRPRMVPGVASVELDGEVVLLDEEHQVHLLNPTAGLLWACFDGRGTVAEIAADVAEAFGVPIEAVQPEVVGLTEDLVARGLLQLDADDGPDAPEPPARNQDVVIVQPGGY